MNVSCIWQGFIYAGTMVVLIAREKGKREPVCETSPKDERSANTNRVIVDIRLRPGLVLPPDESLWASLRLQHSAHYGKKLSSFTKVHNVVQRCQRRTEPRPH